MYWVIKQFLYVSEEGRKIRADEREKKGNRHWLKWNNLYWWFWTVQGVTSIIDLLSVSLCVSAVCFNKIAIAINFSCSCYCCCCWKASIELSHRTKNHADFIDFTFFEWLNEWHNEKAWVILKWVIFYRTLLKNFYFGTIWLLISILYANKI